MSSHTRVMTPLLLAAVLVLGACATQQPRDDAELRNLRADLAEFQADETLSSKVPLALSMAERAVREAGEERLSDDERAHRIHVANKRLEIARSEAFRARARNEVEAVDQRRTELLLHASRLEVEQARRETEDALRMSRATMEEIERTRREAMTSEELREEATRREQEAREEAEAARRLAEAQASEIELARREAQLATESAESMRRRLEYLELRETDRGVVVTLGDVLFATGETELQADALSNIEDVVELLQTEPDKRIRIEGHTDSTGPANVNMRISQQRAEAVRDQLVAMGIEADRIQAVGMGEDFPIASNESSDGRSRNRRVDVILLND
ncbi:OmpA family protein [Wenzhouxiangella sp. AB-CW3]|uniref:OmpA family protein n=1 Tax=Wenzhouxiangella sp. AB-CW3 TaxID=2771012 RepID=UPI00168B04EB|nr:OmpA family protein [Wenzhouxiangella sp. AB-CW3]QOC21667.1 OmpA family protein [Wenzhouxiangella sp. AB-CW3]